MKPIFTEVQRFKKWWHYLIVGTPLLFIAGVGIVTSVSITPAEAPQPLLTIILSFLFMALIFVWFMFLKLETVISEEGIDVKFHGIPFCKRHIAWSEIKRISIITYSPLSDYGGWGVRYGMAGNGWCYNVSGDKGIKLFYKDDKPFLIGTQQSEEARKTIEHYFKT